MAENLDDVYPCVLNYIDDVFEEDVEVEIFVMPKKPPPLKLPPTTS